MRIHATETGSSVLLTAKEKRDLSSGLAVCRLLSAHTDCREASEAIVPLGAVVRRYVDNETPSVCTVEDAADETAVEPVGDVD